MYKFAWRLYTSNILPAWPAPISSCACVSTLRGCVQPMHAKSLCILHTSGHTLPFRFSGWIPVIIVYLSWLRASVIETVNNSKYVSVHSKLLVFYGGHFTHLHIKGRGHSQICIMKEGKWRNLPQVAIGQLPDQHRVVHRFLLGWEYRRASYRPDC
jgi:hypothetical protein